MEEIRNDSSPIDTPAGGDIEPTLFDPVGPQDSPTTDISHPADEPLFDEPNVSPLGESEKTADEVVRALAEFRIVRLSDSAAWQLHPGEASLGRSRHCAIRVSDSGKVSRCHAFITPDADRCLLADNGSSNGTFIDGKRLTPDERVPLNRGQEFSLADERFRLE